MKIAKKILLTVLSTMMSVSLFACGNANSNTGSNSLGKSNSENDKNNNSVDIREENELNRVKVCKQCNAGVKRSKEAAYYYITIFLCILSMIFLV